MSSTFWLDAKLDVSLYTVRYDGHNFGPITWTPVIQCEAHPNGVPMPPVAIGGLQIPHLGEIPVDKVIYPTGPGGYCGSGAPEGILRLNVAVKGAPGALEGETDAYFSLPACLPGQPIHRTVEVLVSIPSTGPNPPGNLWFRFWVGSMC